MLLKKKEFKQVQNRKHTYLKMTIVSNFFLQTLGYTDLNKLFLGLNYTRKPVIKRSPIIHFILYYCKRN